MANRPPSGPRFQIPTVARPPPQPRPRPLASAVPTPFRPPPPSPPPLSPQIPTTASSSSQKSTVNPDYVVPSSSSDKKSPLDSSSRGDIPNAYPAKSQTSSSPAAANAISHQLLLNVVTNSPDHGESVIPPPPPSPFKLPPPLLTTSTQDNHDQPCLLTSTQGAEEEEEYYTSKEKGGILRTRYSGSSIVTLAGENRGATMELELELGKKQRNDGGMINSNVQGVNNSIVYGSSYTHKDPGVHVKVLRKRNGAN